MKAVVSQSAFGFFHDKIICKKKTVIEKDPDDHLFAL